MSELSLNKTKILTAVGALLQAAEKLNKKETLIDEPDVVQLQMCVKKIPRKDKFVKLKLPHSTRRANIEVCLFVKDLDRSDRDYEPTVHHFKDFLRKKGITSVSDIIPLKSLKTEYKPFEAKRNLSNSFDTFLADARIVRLLPTYLGKHFYGKKKIPVQVNLQAKDLATEFESAIGSSSCTISSKGSCSIAVVGHVEMSQDDIADNVLTAASLLSSAVAGRTKNIKQLSIKTRNSTSIPIYMSEGGPQDVRIPRQSTRGPRVEAEEITTVLDGKVKIYPSGRIGIITDGEDDDQKRKLPKEKSLKRQKPSRKNRKDAKPPQSKKFKKKL